MKNDRIYATLINVQYLSELRLFYRLSKLTRPRTYVVSSRQLTDRAKKRIARRNEINMHTEFMTFLMEFVLEVQREALN